MEQIRNWFGFTRRERRSAYVLLLVIFLIIGFRFTVPETNIAIDDVTGTFSGNSVAEESAGTDTLFSELLFCFDPNTAGYDTLIKAGFTSREANTIISYRSKGGRFRHPSDIKKIYGLQEVKADRIMAFIKIKRDTPVPSEKNFIRQQKRLIEINTSDTSQFASLPGIGPVLSVRIVKYRRLLGGFASTEQLKEVYGLSEETFSIISSRIFADTSVICRIKINSADFKTLSGFPYLDRYEVTSILKYRELKGRIEAISDLTENKLITKEKAVKIRPYLDFGY